MPQYIWKAIDVTGTLKTGKQKTANKAQLCHDLMQKNLIAISIRRHWHLKIPESFHALSAATITQFSDQLKLFILAHVPLNKALNTMVTTTRQPTLQRLVNHLITDLKAGKTLSQALSYFPRYFDTTYCHLIAAGENTNQLAAILTHLVQFRRRQAQLRAQLCKVMIYPCLVLFSAIGILVGLVMFVLPQLNNLFHNFRTKLPSITQVLLSFSNWLSTHGLTISMILALTLMVLWLLYRCHKKFAYFCATQTLRLPGIGTLLKNKHLCSWHYLLAMCLQAQLPLPQALELTQNSMTNPSFQKASHQIKKQIEAGHSLANAMQQIPLFTTWTLTFIQTAEQTNHLAQAFLQLNQLHEQQLDRQTELLCKLIEPVIMIALALVIGLLLIAMYLPIFQLGAIL